MQSVGQGEGQISSFLLAPSLKGMKDWNQSHGIGHPLSPKASGPGLSDSKLNGRGTFTRKLTSERQGRGWGWGMAETWLSLPASSSAGDHWVNCWVMLFVECVGTEAVPRVSAGLRNSL